MPETDFESFRQLVLQVPRLQAQLSEVANAEQFSDLAVRLGAERGCHFSVAEVQAALQAAYQAWSMREYMRQPSALTSPPASLTGWVPIDVYQLPGAPQPSVDWCYFGGERFTDSFFQQTIGWRLMHPFARLFRPQTSLEVLQEWRMRQPGLPPAGFIFHLSRCGSTLLAQLLAELPRNVVLSEAPPLDTVLQATGVSETQRIEWLRGMVSALGQPRAGLETHVWIKFDSWHVLQLPLIERAFPGVPWVFLYRDPVEILVSHARQRGMQMIPGMIAPQVFGMEPAQLDGVDFDEYTARTMACICEAAWRHRGVGNGRLVNYHELPEAVYNLLPNFFGIPLSAADKVALQRASGRNAKTPQLPFNSDTAEKQRQATAKLRTLAERWVNPLYQQLETARLAQPALSKA